MIFKNNRGPEACPCRDSGPELRCDCGALVARLAGARIELKCRRCKRVTYVDLEQLRRGGWVAT